MNKLPKATQIQSIGIPNTFKDLTNLNYQWNFKIIKKQSPSSLASPEKLISIIIQETNKQLQKKYKYGFIIEWKYKKYVALTSFTIFAQFITVNPNFVVVWYNKSGSSGTEYL